jgi:hypothetical protein
VLTAEKQDGFLSSTVTVKLHVARFPDKSVAVAVTVVVPTLNASPDFGVETTVTAPGQLSVADGAAKSTVAEPDLPAVTLILAGQFMVGG